MATSRHRASFVDFAHPQVWHKLVEYSEVTITLTKLSLFRQRRPGSLPERASLSLVSNFTNQWAKICFLAASQLHQLMSEFRKKTDLEIRGKYGERAERVIDLLRISTRCPLGGRMYDLWESLLLESELESQVNRSCAEDMAIFCSFSCQVFEEDGVSNGEGDLHTVGELYNGQDTSISHQ